MGSRYTIGLLKITIFLLFSTAVILGLPQLNPSLFPRVGEPSTSYDCDDETLDMYKHFSSLGIETTPVVGNLKLSGENFTQSNHVWLLVKSGEKQIAYDWGTPRFDKQHYEGYKINLDYLLYAVAQDKKDPALLGLASDDSLK
jgi:hypothetical protein